MTGGLAQVAITVTTIIILTMVINTEIINMITAPGFHMITLMETSRRSWLPTPVRGPAAAST